MGKRSRARTTATPSVASSTPGKKKKERRNSVASNKESNESASPSKKDNRRAAKEEQHHEEEAGTSSKGSEKLPPSKATPRLDSRKAFMLPLKKINQHIICSICNGYLIDATTVTECLHTFCKSCLLSHFEEKNYNCPKCDILIHQSHPTHYVAFDRTMQDIVYKLVPGLFKEEQDRRKDAKAARRRAAGIAAVPDKEKNEEDERKTNKCYPNQPPCFSHHRNDDQLMIRLIPERGLEPIARSVIRTSHMTTVNTLKRYLALVYWKDPSKYNALDVYCNGELMGKDYSMRFIQITQWRHHKAGTPLALTYRPHHEY